MTYLSKSLRILLLFLLLLLGLSLIVFVYVAVINAYVPVKLLGNGVVTTSAWDDGLVHAKGTWAIENDQPAAPLNVVDLRCIKDGGKCYAANAQIMDGYLDSYFETFDIKRWDADNLEFGTQAACVKYTYNINRKTSKLSGVRQAKDSAANELCSGMHRGLSLNLVNGLYVKLDLENQHRYNGFAGSAAALWIAVVSYLIFKIVRF